MILEQMPQQVRLIAQQLYRGLAGNHCIEDLSLNRDIGLDRGR
jgi:hypothetical protein